MSNRRKLRAPVLDLAKRTFLERRKLARRNRVSGNLKRRRRAGQP